VFALAPMIVGWSPTVVTTGSMGPTVDAGTVVHVDHSVDLQRLGPGAIITYDDPNVDGRRVTHRVVEVLRAEDGGPTTGFRTKGDANRAADAAVVPLDAVHGATRLVVPYAGVPRVWASEGDWWLVGLLVVSTSIAAVVALDTLASYVTGRTMFRRRSVSAAIAVAIAAMLGGPATNATFAGSTDTTSSTFVATASWYLDAIDADGPVAHWRLDDAPTGVATTVLTEDFESPVAFTQFGSGQVAPSTLQARSGATSAHKTANNDPNGAWAPLPSTVSGSFTFDVWVYRPSSAPGGSVDRLGLEDGSFGGYTFYADHGGNRLRIDRRDGGAATTVSSNVAFDPPEDEWYRLQLVRSGDDLVVSAFDGAGTQLATVTATDATYTTFDRFVVRGGHDYFVDDLVVTQDPPPPTVVDRIGTEDGVPSGTLAPGQPSLLDGLPGTPASFGFDGVSGVLIGDDPLINLTTRAERTVELWFEADSVAGRQVLFEEGGTVNGLSIYLDGGRLYGRAWGASTNWSNPLQVSTGPTAIATGQRHHVSVVLDAVGSRTLELYLDGVLVGTATKTDAGLWNAHSDDNAIGRVNGGTQYHDGNSSAAAWFDGRVDEVVMFNTALPADRVAAHWFAGR
ncbi:MAG: signal peptidase I, partial [Actinomycetota bacterium]